MPFSVIAGRHVPIHAWAPPTSIEPQARAQLDKIAALPWVAHHDAVMPDVHLGKGATVGSVVAMRDAVAPAAVGVDIGCGMAAVKTSLAAADLPDDLGPLRAAIERAIPVGMSAHDEAVWAAAPAPTAAAARARFVGWEARTRLTSRTPMTSSASAMRALDAISPASSQGVHRYACPRGRKISVENTDRRCTTREHEGARPWWQRFGVGHARTPRTPAREERTPAREERTAAREGKDSCA